MAIDLAAVRRIFPPAGSGLPVKTHVTLRQSVDDGFGGVVVRTRDFTMAEAVAKGITPAQMTALFNAQTEAELVRLNTLTTAQDATIVTQTQRIADLEAALEDVSGQAATAEAALADMQAKPEPMTQEPTDG